MRFVKKPESLLEERVCKKTDAEAGLRNSGEINKDYHPLRAQVYAAFYAAVEARTCLPEEIGCETGKLGNEAEQRIPPLLLSKALAA
jgi:hypothetical protein